MSDTEVTPVSPDGVDPKRTATIAALFELALLLEREPDIPIPYELRNGLTVHLLSVEHPREQLARIVRLLPGQIQKRTYGSGPASYFEASAVVGTIPLRVTAFRDAVCERVVTATREVTTMVPDPTVEVPQVEVTKVVEDVEWVCGPLMAPAVDR